MAYYALAKYVGNARRLAEVMQVLVRHGFADLLRRLGVHQGAPGKLLRTLHLLDAPSDQPETLGTRLRAALTDLGPTFIKFGQILSTRPDLVGVSLAKDLELLQDRVTPAPFEQIRPLLEGALGRPIDECFAEFETTPVASASLSQVYRAHLRNGPAVAVKVQRPGIRKIIDADLKLMLGIAQWLEEQAADLILTDPVGLVDEIGRSIRRELNFNIERLAIDEFRANFAHIEEVYVPGTYAECSSEQVLTMDYIDGERIDRLGAYPERNCDTATVSRNACHAICRQVFEFRLFHADPHPGNVFIMRNNQIAFLDYGMVGHLEREDVAACASLLRSVWLREARETVRAMLAFTVSGEVDDYEALERDVGDFIAFEAQTIIASGRVGKAIDQIVAMLHRHQLKLAPRFSLLLKALATIENTGHLLDPKMEVIPIIRTYVDRAVMDRYSPSNLMEDVQHDVVNVLRFARELPEHLHQLMRQARRGRLRLQLDHHRLAPIAAVLDRASNRIAFALIAGALIIGSSQLITTGNTFARNLGLVGFSIAAFLGVGLLISILRSRNY